MAWTGPGGAGQALRTGGLSAPPGKVRGYGIKQ